MFKFEEKSTSVNIRQLVQQIRNYYVENDSIGVLAVLFKKNVQDFPWRMNNCQFFRLGEQNIAENSCIACAQNSNISKYMLQVCFVLRLPVSISQSQSLIINKIEKVEEKQVEFKPDVKELQNKVQYNQIIANVDVTPKIPIKNVTVQNQKLPKDVEEIQNNLINNKIQFEEDQVQNVDNNQKDAQMQQEMEQMQLKQKQEEERQAEQLRQQREYEEQLGLQQKQEEQQRKENEQKEKDRIRLESEEKLKLQLRLQQDQKQKQDLLDMEKKKKELDEKRKQEQLRIQEKQKQDQLLLQQQQEKLRQEQERILREQQEEEQRRQEELQRQIENQRIEDERKQQELLEEQKRQIEEQNKKDEMEKQKKLMEMTKARSNISPLIANMAKYIQTWNNNIQLYFCEDKSGSFKQLMQQLSDAMQVQINSVSTYDNNNTQTFCVFVFFNQSNIPDPVQKIIQQKLECEKHIVMVLQQANLLVLFHLQYNNELVESKVIQGSLNTSQYVNKLKDLYKKFIMPTPKVDLTPIKNNFQQTLTQISCINSLKVLATNEAKQQVVNVAKKDALAQLNKDALQKAKQEAIKQKQQKENEMIQEKQKAQKDAEQKKKLQKIQQIKKTLDQTIQQSPISCLQLYLESTQMTWCEHAASEQIDNDAKISAMNEAQQEAQRLFDEFKRQQEKPKPAPVRQQPVQQPKAEQKPKEISAPQSQLPQNIQEIQQLLMNNQIDFANVQTTEQPIHEEVIQPHNDDNVIDQEKQQFEEARQSNESLITDEYKVLKSKFNKVKDQSYEFLMKALELFTNNSLAENLFSIDNFKYLENGYNDFHVLCSALQQMKGDHDKNRCMQTRQLIEENCIIIKQMVIITAPVQQEQKVQQQPTKIVNKPQNIVKQENIQEIQPKQQSEQKVPQDIQDITNQLKNNQIIFVIENPTISEEVQQLVILNDKPKLENALAEDHKIENIENLANSHGGEHIDVKQEILSSDEKINVSAAHKQIRKLLNKAENYNEKIQKLKESSDVFNDVSKLPDMTLNEILPLINKFTTNSFKDQFDQNLSKDEKVKQEKDKLMIVVGQIMEAGMK